MTATHEELLDTIGGALLTLSAHLPHFAADPAKVARAQEHAAEYEAAKAAVEELRHRLSPGAYWPQATFETAHAIFGGAILNTGSRTYQALDRRIRFALRVWDEKFGPLTDDQERYADEVLAAVLRKAKTEAGDARAKLWPYAQAGIGRAIHHDRVADGMRKRAGYVDPSKILAEIAA